MKYVQLKNEYHQWKVLEKLSKKNKEVSLPSLVSLWRYGALNSAFFKNFRAPYFKRDTGNINNIHIFCPVFMGYLMVVTLTRYLSHFFNMAGRLYELSATVMVDITCNPYQLMVYSCLLSCYSMSFLSSEQKFKVDYTYMF